MPSATMPNFIRNAFDTRQNKNNLSRNNAGKENKRTWKNVQRDSEEKYRELRSSPLLFDRIAG